MNSIHSDCPQVCTLQAKAFAAQFTIHRAWHSAEHADVALVIRIDDASHIAPIMSRACFVEFKDLVSLADYFDAHMASLISGTVTDESFVFVPLELGFQVQALYGEATSRDEGSFSVRVWANVSRPPMTSNVYMGCEGGVEMAEARVFVGDIRAAVTAIQTQIASSGPGVR